MSLTIRLLAVLCVCCAIGAACASPEIPEVIAPPTEAPTPTPTPTPLPTAGPTPTPSPSRFEPGLTGDTMRVAVVADGGAADLTGELAVSAFQAVEAWAASVNATGGLAGRTVEVTRIDTGLFDHAEAMEQVCTGDVFALVGSSALFDEEGLDTLLAPGCRLPDFPGSAFSRERLDSPITFVSNPINGTTWNAGWARHWAEVDPDAVAKAGTLLPELGPFVVAGEQMIEAATEQGYTFVYSPVVGFDDDYAVVAEEMADLEIEAVHWAADGGRFLELLQAMRVADLAPSIVDCGQACYSTGWVERAGRDGLGVTVWLPNLPFEEIDASVELTNYLFWVRNVDQSAEPSAAGVASWAGALLFEESVRRAVGEGTAEFDPGLLTRRRVIEQAAGITEWDANGLHGTANPAQRIPSPCFVAMQLGAGSWRRVHPRRRGTLDCDPANLVRLERTDDLSEAFEPTPTPLASPAPTPEG